MVYSNTTCSHSQERPTVHCFVEQELLPVVKQDCESVHAKTRLQSPYVICIFRLTPIHTSISNGKCWKLNSEHVRTFKSNKQLAHVMWMLIVSITNFGSSHVQVYNEQTLSNLSTFKNWYLIQYPNFGCHQKLQDVSYLLQMGTNHWDLYSKPLLTSSWILIHSSSCRKLKLQLSHQQRVLGPRLHERARGSVSMQTVNSKHRWQGQRGNWRRHSKRLMLLLNLLKHWWQHLTRTRCRSLQRHTSGVLFLLLVKKKANCTKKGEGSKRQMGCSWGNWWR